MFKATRNRLVDKRVLTVKGGGILGHGVLMFKDSVLLNWPAKMSDHVQLQSHLEVLSLCWRGHVLLAGIAPTV